MLQSGPRGVAPLDGAATSKLVTSGRGQRYQKIKDQRLAHSRASLNQPSSLSLIQQDIAKSNLVPGNLESELHARLNFNSIYVTSQNIHYSNF